MHVDRILYLNGNSTENCAKNTLPGCGNSLWGESKEMEKRKKSFEKKKQHPQRRQAEEVKTRLPKPIK